MAGGVQLFFSSREELGREEDSQVAWKWKNHVCDFGENSLY